MRAEAIPLGDKLIAQEAELDRQFANKTISPASLADSMAAIGTTQAELRQAHLKYHLSTAEALTPAQVQRYGELRGYKAGIQHPHGRH